MKVIITETRLESVEYTYEYEGTIEQAKEWFVDNGIYANEGNELQSARLIIVNC